MENQINWGLVNDALDWIEANPEDWDQDDFVIRGGCRTTYCFAGVACMLKDRITINDNGEIFAIDDDGIQSSFESVAEKLLGLNPVQRNAIFYRSIAQFGQGANIEKFREYVLDCIDKYKDV